MILPDLPTLARIAADHDPAVGDSGPDRLFGPWADLADRYALLVAVAHAAFLIPDGGTKSPVTWWRAGHPASPQELRAGVRAVEDTALLPWRIRSVDGSDVALDDPMGLHDPAAPVVIGRTAFRDRPAQEGDFVLARVVRGAGGLVAVGPIALPAWPPAHTVARWWDDLRLRGHKLGRRLLEWSWPS